MPNVLSALKTGLSLPSARLRKLVISDIHGRYDAFRRLMEFAKVDAGDKLHFLGDYIDRGKHSYEVLREVRMHQEQGAVVLRGNHEDMHVLWLMGKWPDKNYYQNGGSATKKSFESRMTHTEYAEMVEWMTKLPYTYEDEEFFYVHAGLVPFEPTTEWDQKTPLEQRHWFPTIADMPTNEMVWARNDFFILKPDYIMKLTGGRKVIHGHTPMHAVMDDGARINIDLGAGGKSKLALVDLTNRFVFTYDFAQDSFDISAIHDVERKF